jgi:hypothetical protein
MQRRSFLAICGVISLTRLIQVSRTSEPSQEVDEPTEVVVSEMRPAHADVHDRIVRDEVGPLPRQSRQVSSVILEVDAVLTPRLAALDEWEDAAMERMERMRDAKGLRCTARQRCI